MVLVDGRSYNIGTSCAASAKKDESHAYAVHTSAQYACHELLLADYVYHVAVAIIQKGLCIVYHK